MRLLLVAFGSQGDIRPMVALGAGLRAAGHEAVLPADRVFRPMIERHGIEFVELPGDLRAEMAAVQAGLLRSGTSPRFLIRAIVAGWAQHSVPWARRLLEVARGADAVVAAGLGIYLGLSVAEALGVPVLLGTPVPVAPSRAYPPAMIPPRRLPGPVNLVLHHAFGLLVWHLMRPSLNRGRREALGLPPMTARRLLRLVREGSVLQLHAYSPVLVPPAPDFPPEVRVTGAWRLADTEGWTPPEGLLRFLAAGPPPVYLGFGSMAGADPVAATRLALEALGGRRAVLATGWGGFSADLPLPGTAYALDEAPHDWLLPRMSLAVHHGGAGTTHAVARAGIASVVVPFLGDQPFWAWRLRELGAAPAALLRRKLTAPALAAAIAAAEDPAMRARAAALGEGLQAEDGVAAAVAAIERRLSCR